VLDCIREFGHVFVRCIREYDGKFPNTIDHIDKISRIDRINRMDRICSKVTLFTDHRHGIDIHVACFLLSLQTSLESRRLAISSTA
jgi:hypothetical protein